jgi:hypothetical protein
VVYLLIGPLYFFQESLGLLRRRSEAA